jgi:hypothetical protein
LWVTMHHMTKNPRITVTLTPSTYATLSELSKLTDSSMSSLVSGLLDESTPVFTRMIRVLDAAVVVQAEGKKAMVDALSNAQDKMEAQLGLVLEIMDDGTRPLIDQAEEVRRRGRKSGPGRGTIAATAGAPTPISNRGVRSTPTHKKVIAKSPEGKTRVPAKVAAKRRGVEK